MEGLLVIDCFPLLSCQEQGKDDPIPRAFHYHDSTSIERDEEGRSVCVPDSSSAGMYQAGDPWVNLLTGFTIAFSNLESLYLTSASWEHVQLVVNESHGLMIYK